MNHTMEQMLGHLQGMLQTGTPVLHWRCDIHSQICAIAANLVHSLKLRHHGMYTVHRSNCSAPALVETVAFKDPFSVMQGLQEDDAPIGPFIPQEEDEMVGPAVPPEDPDGDNGDAWDGRGMGEPDEQEDPYRLPVTSEVALEGKSCSRRAVCRLVACSACFVPHD